MNREQLHELVRALQSIAPSSREDAIARALRVLNGEPFESAFGHAYGEVIFGSGARWGE